MSVLVGGNRPVTRFYNFDILQFLEGTVTVANATTYRITDATGYHQFTGNFTYDPDGALDLAARSPAGPALPMAAPNSRCQGSITQWPCFSPTWPPTTVPAC